MESGYQDFGDTDVQVYLGELRGYRYWYLSDSGDLCPVSGTNRNTAWQTMMTATCVAVGEYFLAIPPNIQIGISRDTMQALADRKGRPMPDVHSPAPDARCTCGLYAWYDPGDAGKNHRNLRVGLTGGIRQIFGVVAASGLIVPGTTGFRAERARLVAVVMPPRRVWSDWFTATSFNYTREACLRRYPEVKVFDSVDSLVAQYPPERMKQAKAA